MAAFLAAAVSSTPAGAAEVTPATIACGAGAIPSEEAAAAVGKSVTVYVARVYAAYKPNVARQPTFLNDRRYPNHTFTAVVFGADRPAFPYPPESLDGKQICVTGQVKDYKGKPQIIVAEAGRIKRLPSPQ